MIRLPPRRSHKTRRRHRRCCRRTLRCPTETGRPPRTAQNRAISSAWGLRLTECPFEVLPNGRSYVAHWAWRTGQVRAVALGTSGMSDPNAGRYLEAWLPSNLIWDRFPVRLDIQITATLAAHSIHQRSCHRSQMPTNGRCSSRSTTHRCHTCCLRIHATAFRTLQDAEPRDHPAGDMNLFGCCSVACATKHTAPSRHDTISK
jgi:hypothetical protein